MAKIKVPAAASDQDRELAVWMEQVTAAIEKHGMQFSDLPEAEQARLLAPLKAEVLKANDELRSEVATLRQRCSDLVTLGGGDERGAARQRHATLGALVLHAAAAGDPELRATLAAHGFDPGGWLKQHAQFDPSTGQRGGFVMPTTMFEGIINRLPQYGVFEADCPPQPCNHNGKVLTWTENFMVYCPDVGGTPTASGGSFGAMTPSLKRWTVETYFDRWMGQEPLLVDLGSRLELGMARGLAKKGDDIGFLGDGSQASFRGTGIFNWVTGAADESDYVVTGASGDNTYEKMLDKPHVYLLSAIGAVPEEYDDGNLRWYGHKQLFFRTLGAKDTNGRPIADIFLLEPVNRYQLYAMPYRFVRGAPKLSDSSQASKVFMCLANLPAAVILARHPTGVELRQSLEARLREGLVTLLLDVLQDILLVAKNRAAVIQLKTNAA